MMSFGLRSALLSSLFLVGIVTRAAADTRPPNVVLILMDDLGWTDLACFGSTYHETPHLDQLARCGLKFTNGYAACPVCSPTRASILTGKYPARLHLTDYIPGSVPANAKLKVPNWKKYLDLDEITLAKALKPAGYVSACIGKWHLGGDQGMPDGADSKNYGPERHGFDVNVAGCSLGQPPDYFFPYQRKLGDGRLLVLPGLTEGRAGEYLTDRLTDEAEKFMECQKDKPFFLYLSHYAVHTAVGARLQGKPELVAKYQAKKRGTHANPAYAAMVESMDDSVGRIVRKLEELKLADRTLVIFTSDNGGYADRDGMALPATNNAPLRAGKGYLYEGGLRVPWLIAWPGVIAPGLSEVPISSVDCLPTILEAAGVKVHPQAAIDGVSLWPLLKKTGTVQRDALYWHYPHYRSVSVSPGGAIRQGDFKLIEYFEDGKLELYNLKDDLGEKQDLAAKLPDKAAALHRRLGAWRAAVQAQMPSK